MRWNIFEPRATRENFAMNRKHFTTLVLGKLLAETFAESVMKRPIYHGISSILSSLPHEIATCRRQFVLFFSLSRSASLFVPLHDFLQSRRCEFYISYFTNIPNNMFWQKLKLKSINDICSSTPWFQIQNPKKKIVARWRPIKTGNPTHNRSKHFWANYVFALQIACV